MVALSMRVPGRRLRLGGAAGLPALTLIVNVVCAGAAGAAGLSESAFNQCRAIVDDAARLRCFESITAEPAPPAGAAPLPSPPAAPGAGAATISTPSMGKWRLVRTPHPQGGKDAVSIMHPAELSGSDPDFAGLMLRCGEADVEVLIAVINPYPLRAHPHVTVQDEASSHAFDSSVAPPGALVLLPPEATALARSTWLSAPQITAAVEDGDHAAIKGTVRLDGLKTALGTLVANCPQKGP